MQNLLSITSSMVAVAGGRMQAGWGHASWLLTVIALLAVLQLHNMVGVAGTRMPRELLLQNCLKIWIVGIICLGMVSSLVSFSSFVLPLKKKEVIDS